MRVHELVAAFAGAAESADSMQAVREVLDGMTGKVAAIEQSLAYIKGSGGNANQVFYRSPQLTLLKVLFPNGRRTPPHDHGTWATIMLLSGEEKNTLYRVEDGRLRRAGEATLQPGKILSMREDVAHVAECVGDRPTVGLHVYGGDIFMLPRRMWDPETLQAHPLDWTIYETFARKASAASGAPQT